MKKELSNEFTEAQQEVLKSIRLSRVILPILLGIGVVAYLLWKQYDPNDFQRIDWTSHTYFWIGLSFVLLVVRHIAYAIRLRILSDGQFSWRKCVELIFIWEFSSAVSPTSVGGSAVALFVLAQEKLSTAKTATIVIYSAVLDTIFFISTLPVLLFFLGTAIIRPNMISFNDLDGWGYTFIGAYFFMALYGGLFFYGLFINPTTIKKVLVGATRLGFLRRFRHRAIELGNEIIIASQELKSKRWPFHLGAFGATATAWSCRFLLLNCLFIALAPDISMAFLDQFRLYARLETMFVVMAFSPTPGGAGFAEFAFFGFTSDYISEKGIAVLIAAIWRLLTYYAYLLVGAIIIPNWIRNILNQRQQKKIQTS
ncbi:MAG: lysylphosphatidylglycerol synthase transmembrane domain-containing protein [Bacteroidota bacterium]